MNLLHALASGAHTIEDAIDGNLKQPAIQTAKMVNRNTPWGQANQAHYNAAHQGPRPQPQGGLQVVQGTGTLGNMYEDGSSDAGQQLQGIHPDIQSIQNPGATPFQNAGYGRQLMPQQNFSQQQPQMGVTEHPLLQQLAQLQMPQFTQYQRLNRL